MPLYEIYDYVDIATPDVDQTLSLHARGQVNIKGRKSQVVHVGDDDSEERISFSDTSVFSISYPFSKLKVDDAGTVFNFWHSASLGNGLMNTFKLDFFDGHTYVVRFDCDLDQVVNGHLYSYDVVFKVLGKVAD